MLRDYSICLYALYQRGSYVYIIWWRCIIQTATAFIFFVYFVRHCTRVFSHIKIRIISGEPGDSTGQAHKCNSTARWGVIIVKLQSRENSKPNANLLKSTHLSDWAIINYLIHRCYVLSPLFDKGVKLKTVLTLPSLVNYSLFLFLN